MRKKNVSIFFFFFYLELRGSVRCTMQLDDFDERKILIEPFSKFTVTFFYIYI